MLVAWRLVVLQAAHPVVAAGIAEHSTYRGHPWRRIEHTMASGRRLFQADEEQLWREVQRLDRAHRRIRGTAEDGRGYDAHDPAARAWVLLTLFESVVAMRELSGEPYPAEELEASYREFAGIAAVFGLSSAELPATAAELRARLRRTVLDELEFTDTTRHLLFDVLREAPCPRRLRLLGPVGWRVLSAVVARLVADLTVADLPAVFRERFGLVPTRRGRLLSLLLHRGGRAVVTRLPDRHRYRAPGVRSSDRPRRPPRQDTRPPRLDRFFREVLDQTGDGHLTAHDFRAMAHNVCWQLELSEEGRPGCTTPSSTGGRSCGRAWTPTATAGSPGPSTSPPRWPAATATRRTWSAGCCPRSGRCSRPPTPTGTACWTSPSTGCCSTADGCTRPNSRTVSGSWTRTGTV